MIVAPLKPFGALSREHLREALTVYSVWWLEVYLAVVVLFRLGVARLLDTAGYMDSTLPLPPVPHPYLFGAVQVTIALAWVYALTVTSRPLRAVVAWMAAGCFAALAHTWYGFAAALPNWHGLVGSAVFAGLVATRHSLQWRYGAASAGDTP